MNDTHKNIKATFTLFIGLLIISSCITKNIINLDLYHLYAQECGKRSSAICRFDFINMTNCLICESETYIKYSFIGHLEHSLSLNSCRVVSAKFNFTFYKNFRKLKININSLSKLEFVISDLEELDASSNKIEYIEDFVFKEAKNLKKLNLSNNKLKEFSDINIAGSSLSNLQILDLSRNNISVIEPFDFPSIRNLSLLSLSNQSRNLNIHNHAFSNIRGKFVLNLDHNKIDKLEPRGLCFRNLSMLNIQYSIIRSNNVCALKKVNKSSTVRFNVKNKDLCNCSLIKTFENVALICGNTTFSKTDCINSNEKKYICDEIYDCENDYGKASTENFTATNNFHRNISIFENGTQNFSCEIYAGYNSLETFINITDLWDIKSNIPFTLINSVITKTYKSSTITLNNVNYLYDLSKLSCKVRNTEFTFEIYVFGRPHGVGINSAYVDSKTLKVTWFMRYMSNSIPTLLYIQHKVGVFDSWNDNDTITTKIEPHVNTNHSITSEIAIEAINLHRKFIRIQIRNMYGLSEPSEQELVVKNTSGKTLLSNLLYFLLLLNIF